MSNIVEQVIAFLIGTAILGLLGNIARRQPAFIRFIKQQPNLFTGLYLVLLLLAELVATSIGISIFIVQVPLLLVLWILLRERYSPQPLRILSATWGKNDTIVDVTKKLQSKVKDGQITNLPVDGTIFVDDPCSGHKKELNVVYVAEYNEVFEEGKNLSIPHPTAFILHMGAKPEQDTAIDKTS